MTLYDDSPDEYVPTLTAAGAGAVLVAAAFVAAVWWWLR
jgi:hypothetical protein